MNISKSEERFAKIQQEIEGLPFEDPRWRAFQSAWDNAEDTAVEGAFERLSDEFFECWESSYETMLAQEER